MNPINQQSARRRLGLRVAVKLMGWMCIAAVVYVFIAAVTSGTDEVPTVPSLRVTMQDMQQGEARIINWEGRPVIVHRRSAANLRYLERDDPRLLDPQSVHSRQSEAAANRLRSVEPEWFVAIALGTDLGCSLRFLPANPEPFQGLPWAGGFIDSCRGARYDLAGRVYDSQWAKKNLMVPPYRISDGTLILGG